MDKKTKIISGVVLLLAVGYAILWFYFADFSKKKVAEIFRLDKEKILVSGNPFEINLKIEENSFVKKMSISILNKGISVNFDDDFVGLNKNVDSDNKFTASDLKISYHFKSYIDLISFLRKVNENTTEEEIFVEALNMFNSLEWNSLMNLDGVNADYKMVLFVPDMGKYTKSSEIASDLPKKYKLLVSLNSRDDRSESKKNKILTFKQLINHLSLVNVKAEYEMDLVLPSDKKFDINKFLFMRDLDLFDQFNGTSLSIKAMANSDIATSSMVLSSSLKDSNLYLDMNGSGSSTSSFDKIMKEFFERDDVKIVLKNIFDVVINEINMNKTEGPKGGIFADIYENISNNDFSFLSDYCKKFYNNSMDIKTVTTFESHYPRSKFDFKIKFSDFVFNLSEANSDQAGLKGDLQLNDASLLLIASLLNKTSLYEVKSESIANSLIKLSNKDEGSKLYNYNIDLNFSNPEDVKLNSKTLEDIFLMISSQQ